MRFIIPQILLALSALSPALAAPAKDGVAEPKLPVLHKRAPAVGKVKGEFEAAEADEDAEVKPTEFNGITVPPLKEIKGDDFKNEIKEGYWFVKHHSPWCVHCQAIAPTWQTLYEFYYTSNPVPASGGKSDHATSLNSFHGYYNFHFGSLNCMKWGDQCIDNGVEAWPTFILYKDGKEYKRYTDKDNGKKNMENLSSFIEEVLDSIKPGSRPAKGLKLPEPGDTSVEGSTPDDPKAKDKDPEAGSKAGKKHNKVAEEYLQVKKVGPSGPVATPNPAGASVPLTQESFQKLVTQTQDPWFIKFYAPWCHHCQAMAPSWHQMARELQGTLNVGEVNCDVERRLCKDAKVRGFPTIHFFRGGERVEYQGLRGLGDLVSYAKKAVDIGKGVEYVDVEKFEKMEETEEVIFIYFFDIATTSEDFQALDRLCLSLIGHAKLVKTDSLELAERFKIHSWPRLLVSRSGRPSYFNALAPKDMRDFRQVLNWMKSVWLPIVPELTASNAHEIMDGRFVVLGVLNRDNADEFVLSKRELKSAAFEWMDREVTAFRLARQELRDSKQLRIEEAQDRGDDRALRDAKGTRIQITEQDRKQVGFAWVDGVFWERWIRTTYGIDVKNGERVVINDEDNKRYWDETITGASINPSRSYILETLQKITADPPKIPPKYTAGFIEKLYMKTKNFSKAHPVWASALFVGAIAVAIFVGRGRRGRLANRSRAISTGFFNLDSKEGFLNGGTTEKKD